MRLILIILLTFIKSALIYSQIYVQEITSYEKEIIKKNNIHGLKISATDSIADTSQFDRTYKYDKNGNVIYSNQNNSLKTNYFYDKNNRLVKTILSKANPIKSTYLINEKRPPCYDSLYLKKIKYDSILTIDYAYNPKGRMVYRAFRNANDEITASYTEIHSEETASFFSVQLSSSYGHTLDSCFESNYLDTVYWKTDSVDHHVISERSSRRNNGYGEGIYYTYNSTWKLQQINKYDLSELWYGNDSTLIEKKEYSYHPSGKMKSEKLTSYQIKHRKKKPYEINQTFFNENGIIIEYIVIYPAKKYPSKSDKLVILFDSRGLVKTVTCHFTIGKRTSTTQFKYTYW